MVREEPADLLTDLSAAAYDRLLPRPVGDLAAGPGTGAVEWVSVADLLMDPGLLEPLVKHGSLRFRSNDQGLVLAQVAREAVAALAAAAVDLWVRQRRLLDLTAANVVLGAGETAFLVGVRRARLAILAEDPLVGHPDVVVVDEVEMFDRLLGRSFGKPMPAGAAPDGLPDTVAAIAAIVTAVRRLVRCGDRHLWGTAALAAVNATTRLSHTLGCPADADRARLLAARPDLARTIELATIPDETITFPLRRTCCLLFKLPDGQQCGTCSLRDRDEQLARMTDWHRQQRRRLRVGAERPIYLENPTRRVGFSR